MAARRRERDVTDQVHESTTTVKRRKMEEEVDVESRIVLSPCVTQSTNRGGIVAVRNSAGASETTVVTVRRRDSPVEEQCQISLSSDLDSASVFCCSGDIRSEEKSKRRIEFVDFEENNGGGDQIETSWIYDNFIKRNEESVNYTAMENQSSEDSVVESRRRLKKSRETTTVVEEAEIEDFFQTAEKDLRNKVLECSRKYNFDFEKDEPLGGRYEWVKLNP